MLGRYLPKVPIDLCLKTSKIIPHLFLGGNLLDFKGVQKSQIGTVDSSFVKVKIPIKEQIDHFVWKNNKVRIGRMLQLMDSLSGISGFLYCKQYQNQVTLATAVMDNFYSHQQIKPYDLQMQAFVVSTGNTSLQIITNIIQDEKVKAQASFVFVCRNLKDYSSHTVPKININKDEINLAKINEKAKQRQKQRKIRRLKLSQQYIPSEKQFHLIHLLLTKKQIGVQMQKTKITTTRILHQDTKNYHGKVFGGLLMRLAHQTAYITARQFYNGGNFQFAFINDVVFLKPVDLGSIVEIRSKIIYCQDVNLVIQCQVWTRKFYGGQNQKCTSMVVCFRQKNGGKLVYPTSYYDAIQYIKGKNLKYFKK